MKAQKENYWALRAGKIINMGRRDGDTEWKGISEIIIQTTEFVVPYSYCLVHSLAPSTEVENHYLTL